MQFRNLAGKMASWLPEVISHIPTTENVLFLTFDDGPHPHITPWVLNLLHMYDAKATFFLVGARVDKNKTLVEEIMAAGHAVGNHTYHHLNGWRTPTAAYLTDTALCTQSVPSTLFRPPYGKLTTAQYVALKTNYKIVMWSCLTADYDPKINREQCLENAKKGCSKGSIIVFHDSEKALKNLEYTLPKLLEYASDKGFRFKAIPV
jgi:peptidoglycan/xylan/chitin deacetylase (PgdA/CDA1 family)